MRKGPSVPRVSKKRAVGAAAAGSASLFYSQGIGGRKQNAAQIIGPAVFASGLYAYSRSKANPRNAKQAIKTSNPAKVKKGNRTRKR